MSDPIIHWWPLILWNHRSRVFFCGESPLTIRYRHGCSSFSGHSICCCAFDSWYNEDLKGGIKKLEDVCSFIFSYAFSSIHFYSHKVRIYSWHVLCNLYLLDLLIWVYLFLHILVYKIIKKCFFTEYFYFLCKITIKIY